MKTNVVLSCLLLVNIAFSANGAEVHLRKFATSFLKVLNMCKKELGLSDRLLSDLYNYWNQEYESLQRETGCAIICMSNKMEMLDYEGGIHHDNVHEFAMHHGAAEDIATKLVDLANDCQERFKDMEDECLRILEVAKCFRTEISTVGWAPTMDVALTEILTGV